MTTSYLVTSDYSQKLKGLSKSDLSVAFDLDDNDYYTLKYDPTEQWIFAEAKSPMVSQIFNISYRLFAPNFKANNNDQNTITFVGEVIWFNSNYTTPPGTTGKWNFDRINDLSLYICVHDTVKDINYNRKYSIECFPGTDTGEITYLKMNFIDA